jgi:poly(3-hydroxybutyrate) depolymerase
MTVDGRPVSLDAIDCPVTLIGGEEDHITPPAQVFAFADHVGTDPSRVTRQLVRGGHLGLFMGRDSLEFAWRPLFERLAADGAG